tara:strand:- start:8471 stop:9334 length:864 start_codon:yes stop_codon:yes gene_type:complete
MIYSVGSIFLDHVIKIDSFPKNPVKVIANGIEKRLGGSAAVASVKIKKLGLDVSFIGRLGDDDISKYLRSELSKFKINQKNIISIKNTKSSHSYVYEDKKGERLLAAFSDKKLINNKKLPKVSFTRNTTFMTDLRWIEATLHIAKKCQKKKLNQIVDLDNYKLNSTVKQIICISSHPVFSETGAFEYTKIKSIISSLKKMLKQPIIINSSRGSIINEEDLLKAYDEKLISGFALDVYSSEPVQKSFLNNINKNINCILTPHVAGVTEESNTRVTEFIAKAVKDFFKL